RPAGLALAFGALTAASAAGQCPELDHLVPPDTTNLFGRALAVDGDTLLVGAPADHGVGNTSGAIYFYERAGDAWVEADKVHAAPGAADQYFGWSVDVAGDIAVVGAQYAGEGAHNGLAFVFEKIAAGWTQRAAWSTDRTQWNGFGQAVATDGTHVVLGEPGAHVAWVYFRHYPDWLLWAQLYPWDTCDGWPRFGAAVEVDNYVAYVGAPGSGLGCPGAVYVFDIDLSTGGTSPLQKLTPSDPTGVVGFGRSLALDGERLVVGTEPGFGPGTASGRAYVFEREAGVWVERAVLQPHDSGPLSQFGVAVAVEGDRILVGDTAAELPPAYDGAAYLFQRESDGTWSERQKFVPAGAATDDDFGRAVALDGDDALVGAPQADVELGVEGAVYRFPAA
ncbi:MAG TPA: hypothetical protein VJP77_00050, partial [Planctomycetota bacterium]|nr:hypothetical protein [Planctomycetota bacterium]